MTKAHPHAALMLQYAQDAAETETPWERWEWCPEPSESGWEPFCTHPVWYRNIFYRRKPQTITVNGFQVPAPVKDRLQPRNYYAPDPTTACYWAYQHYTTERAQLCFERGLLHTTKEAAVAHAKAMLGIDPKGE